MSSLLVVALIVLLSLVLITLLHIRVRLSIESNLKTLFVGLGRTGVLTNFTDQTRSIIVSGKSLKTSPIEEELLKPKKEKPAKKSKRTRPFSDIVAIIPDTFRAFGKYIYSVVKSIIIEEFGAEVKVGLPDPYLTGIAFGYYQAAVGAVPFLGRHFKFTPDWNEVSITGGLKTTVSIPLYKIIYRTTVLVFGLPLRKLVKLAIGRKDRKQNGRAE